MYLLLPLVWVQEAFSEFNRYEADKVNLWLFVIGTVIWLLGLKFLADFLKIKNYAKVAQTAVLILLVEASLLIIYEAKYYVEKFVFLFSLTALVLTIFAFKNIRSLIKESLENANSPSGNIKVKSGVS